MMNAVQVITALGFFVSLVLFASLLLSLWPSYRLDSFRQKMFALRDELFDYAADGHIGFNEPAYRLLRQLMNGFIRYAHQLTFYRLCLAFLMWHFTEKDRTLHWTESWSSAIGSTRDENVKHKLNEFYSRSLILVMKRVITGSPLLVLCVFITGTAVIVHGQWKNIKGIFKAAGRKVGSRIINDRI